MHLAEDVGIFCVSDLPISWVTFQSLVFEPRISAKASSSLAALPTPTQANHSVAITHTPILCNWFRLIINFSRLPNYAFLIPEMERVSRTWSRSTAAVTSSHTTDTNLNTRSHTLLSHISRVVPLALACDLRQASADLLRQTLVFERQAGWNASAVYRVHDHRPVTVTPFRNPQC